MGFKSVACIAALGWMACGTAASADEVTKTTTTTTKTDPTVVVSPPPGPAVVTDGTGCDTKKVTKTNGDTGDSVQKTEKNCD